MGGNTKAVCYALSSHYYSGMADEAQRDTNTIRTASLGMAECVNSGLKWHDIFGFFAVKLVKHLPADHALGMLLCEEIKAREYEGVSKEDARRIFEKILATSEEAIDAIRIAATSVTVSLPVIAGAKFNPVIAASKLVRDDMDLERLIAQYKRAVDDQAIAARHSRKGSKREGSVGEVVVIEFNAANDLYDTVELEGVELIASIGDFANDAEAEDLMNAQPAGDYKAVPGFRLPTRIRGGGGGR